MLVAMDSDGPPRRTSDTANASEPGPSNAIVRWQRLRWFLSRRSRRARVALLVASPTVLARSGLVVTIMLFGLATGVARQARAQTLCEVPGGSGVIQLAVGIIVSLVAIGAILKFGAGFLQWLTGSQRAFYFSIAAGVVAIFVAANFDAIIPWLFEQTSSGGGGGISGAGVDCLSGGGGG